MKCVVVEYVELGHIHWKSKEHCGVKVSVWDVYFKYVHINMLLSPQIINEIWNLVINGSQKGKPIRKLSEVENQLR